MDSLSILERARLEPLPGKPRKIDVSPYLPTIDHFRRQQRDWSYIWEWLKKDGQIVHEKMEVFRAVASRKYNKWVKKIIREGGK